MKNLELDSMDKVLGGSCSSDVVGLGFSAAGLVPVALAAGPIGWAGGLAILTFSVAGASLIGNGDCF